MATSHTPDGYDGHLTVNNLSHVLMANRLLPLMRKTSKMPGVSAGDVRIVGQSSELHRGSKMASNVKFESEQEFKELMGQSRGNISQSTYSARLTSTNC